MSRSTGLTGAAGEYHVAAELSRRDWLATVTIKNAPGTDVLAQRRDRKVVVAIQVKTASEGYNFRLGVKDEDPGERDHEWYAFVSLRGDEERPSFYVMPRHVVAAIVYLEHREWLDNLGWVHNMARPGHVRRENPGRSMRMKWIEGYREAWGLLDQPARRARFLGDPAFLDLESRYCLPEGHRRLGKAT